MVENQFEGTGNWEKLYKEKFNKDRFAKPADVQQLQKDAKEYTFQPNALEYQIKDKLAAAIQKKMSAFTMRKQSLGVISENSVNSGSSPRTKMIRKAALDQRRSSE